MNLVRPFEPGDLTEAGVLLAARHARHRKTRPLLSARYEDPALARAELVGAYQQDDASVRSRCPAVG